MRENLIIILLTVTHDILQKIMLKFLFLFNSIIHYNSFYQPLDLPFSTPPPPLYSNHQQVALANNKMLTEIQKANILLNEFFICKQEK